MIIRKFQAADLEAILELFHDVVHKIGAKYYNTEQVQAWAPSNIDKEKWLKSLTTNITLVAEDQGEIIGFGDMSHTGYIDRLYVHKNYQGKGVALALFKKLEEEARKLGIVELTTESSVMAKSIAERQGFEVVQKQNKVLRGQEFITYLMRKKL
ncbi:MAG TPA: GNAT family N-acetyltransferase [Rhabdochlamydiaceae bacterium]